MVKLRETTIGFEHKEIQRLYIFNRLHIDRKRGI